MKLSKYNPIVGLWQRFTRTLGAPYYFYNKKREVIQEAEIKEIEYELYYSKDIRRKVNALIAANKDIIMASYAKNIDMISTINDGLDMCRVLLFRSYRNVNIFKDELHSLYPDEENQHGKYGNLRFIQTNIKIQEEIVRPYVQRIKLQNKNGLLVKLGLIKDIRLEKNNE